MKNTRATNIAAKGERAGTTPARPDAARPNGAAHAGGPAQDAVNDEMRRLMHKAAWNRMFGQAERRNPYAK